METRKLLPPSAYASRALPSWTFLTNHGHVLLYLAGSPDARISEIADAVGITERAAQRIVSELVEAGYLTRTRVGRRNHYEIDSALPLRHPLERDHEVGRLVRALARPRRRPESAGSADGDHGRRG